MIKQLGQLDLFHLVLSPAMCLPLHVPSKRPPQQNPSPMPSTNRKKCLRLSTCILFTSTSLRFPHSKSSMSSLHTSFLSMVQTSKSVSTLSNFARQYHQPPHFKVYSDQPLQLFNALHVHFGCTGGLSLTSK